MIDHVGVTVSDYEKSKAFYLAALEPLGYALFREIPREYTGGKGACGFAENGDKGKPDFWIGEGSPPRPGVHVAFQVGSQTLVEAFYRAALAAGGRDNGPPGPRPQYHEAYYGAFVLDPDGHNIEAVCHRPK